MMVGCCTYLILNETDGIVCGDSVMNNSMHDMNLQGVVSKDIAERVIQAMMTTSPFCPVSQAEVDDFNWTCQCILTPPSNQEKERMEAKVWSFLVDLRNAYKLFEILSASTSTESVVFVTCEIMAKIIAKGSGEAAFINAKEANATAYPIAVPDSSMSSEAIAMLKLFAFFVKLLYSMEQKQFAMYTVRSICNVLAELFKKLWAEQSFTFTNTLVNVVVSLLDQVWEVRAPPCLPPRSVTAAGGGHHTRGVYNHNDI